MKIKLFLSLLIVFSTISFIFLMGCKNQNSTKQQYELQEKCGKSGEEYFRNKYGGDGWYNCHYNNKLNKCFFHYNHLSSGEVLIDISENKNYGSCYSSGSCYVLDKKNLNSVEWDKIVKPYMEE